MKYDPEKHHRRSIRLKGYDYSQQGAYFVTICTKNRACLFGEIQQGQMNLNDLGKVVNDTWGNLPNHYAYIELDTFVIMPNHIHGIILLSDILVGAIGAGLKPAPTTATITKRQPLSEIIRALKTFSARRINAYRNTVGSPVWQRNYYEHIIRDEDSLDCIRQYIMDNPKNWQSDRENSTSTIAGAGLKRTPTNRNAKPRDEIHQWECY
jgi:REP element-mobilizing transposase RayT